MKSRLSTLERTLAAEPKAKDAYIFLGAIPVVVLTTLTSLSGMISMNL